MNEINEKDLEQSLAGQIPEAPIDNSGDNGQEPAKEESLIGKTLSTGNFANRYEHNYSEESKRIDSAAGLSQVGENIKRNAEIREGWMDFDRRLLGERNKFYPEDWEFRVRPATVEAIRNWSTIDDENFNVIDDVFNEILKQCLMIVKNGTPIPCTNINTWDRFFFILIIREYTFTKGEKQLQLFSDCPSCDNEVEFNLLSSSLLFDMPDDSIMHYYDPATQTWTIDPNEYDVEWPEPIVFYLPTVEREANIKAWLIDQIQNKKKVDQVFLKFLSWMTPKIPKDLTIAQRQIKTLKQKFQSYPAEMFSLMNDIIKNITVVPDQKLITTCPICGEEVTTDITFQNGVSDIFNFSSGHKQFGKK